MFVGTHFWNSAYWKNETLSFFDFHVVFVWFSSCPLKIHSLSPSLHPPPHLIHAILPHSFVLDPFLMMCITCCLTHSLWL